MKDSGIEWIGKIPEGWEISKLKFFITCLDGKRIPVDSGQRNEGPYPYWGAGSITDYIDKYIFDEELVLLGEDGAPFFDKSRDVSFYINEKVWINNHIHVLKPKFSIDAKYLTNFLNCVDYGSYINGTILSKLTQGNMNNIAFVFPPKETQQKIANYLDEKCSQIEQTIQNQQQVIEKLKAYKQSLITEAVTGKVKIQNGKVAGKYEQYKDSGVEYLANIPASWTMKRLRYIGSCQNGISKGGEYFGSGYPFVSYGDVYKNIVLPETVSGLIESTEDERKNYSVKAGDIFFTRTSETIEEVGFTSVCMKTIENATFAGFVIRVRPNTDELILDFSKYYFKSDAHRRFFVKEMNLVTRASLSQDLLKRLPVLIPPKEEQKAIAEYLDKTCVAIDSAIEQKQKLIEKLTEYKKSLIYECVTGKKEI